MTTQVAWLAPICAAIGIIVAAYLGSWVLKQNPGPDKMNSISLKIQQGAQAFLMSEYKLLIIFMVVVAVIMAVALSPITAIAFVTGGVLSAAAGYVGMYVATRANTRTAYAAEESVAKALNVSFKSGLTMGLCVASFALMGLSLWLIFLVFGVNLADPQLMHENIGMVEGFATGASAVALFARVGGGIYTKAADVGADLVGKVEAGIPEDDPRNPATIADNVGDNVGDVAGMGADLFESYTGAILAPTILAVTFGSLGGYFTEGDFVWTIVVPVMIAACGIITSIIGLFAVRTKEGADLHKALNRGTYVAAGIEILVILAIFAMWQSQSAAAQPVWLFGSVICGLVAGLAIGKITEYFCSDHYNPVHKIAAAAETGAATVVIEGLGTGMLSTIAPICLVAFAIIGAFFCGNMAFPAATIEGGVMVGLYGVALAATGMLSNTAITIGVDAYGPVADNAGGIAEMAGLPEEVRDRTDALDAVGNTTAAIAKGFAISSAGLAAISLFVSYQATMHHYIENFELTLTDPLIVAGIFIGAMMPFMFAALTMGAVSRAAHAMVEEVRRQFREIKGIMEYEAEPEYDKCVAISTSSALKEMMLPGCLAIVVPVVIGCFNPAMLGGFLAGAVATGMLLAIFMSNSGGAWDNAKKYIEQGNFGGKGSEAHKAAVVGDTVGDPFKDTSGPSMNILINLMTIVSLTFSPLFITIQSLL
ncbi:sodium-translocating pyrophosphatase [Parvibacter caecicola]|uniref:Putative K(+)-stimulated pyrophosphate-energized sodium pump n=1 Tax=Parvibacter caecicola TaxID=747645 RepID=A0A7W5D102_9ACTN|nr:sodium-translocating pyrophosphatase [Parvibacter caecicola]MBB3170743.1 K(+)-stimulated pyrophosphate-energized sodium pump [Parvibacter caecicola]MCR2041299.1 sodium-translocating pyrophosphatase [Parvibacter caecicola]RNL09176.1 sodium-translocating pyrophosphatase [Parvibacter caecicola]